MESISDISDAAASSRPVQSERPGQSERPVQSEQLGQQQTASAQCAEKRWNIRSVAALIAMELAHVVFWLAQIVAYLALGSIALVGLAIAIPLFAELERWLRGC